jgi:hypothetical protein
MLLNRIFISPFRIKIYSKIFYSNCFRTLDAKTVEKDISELEIKVQQGYHIILYGLDVDNYSVFDLAEEIFFEIKNYTKLGREDIFILDELSLLRKLRI